METVDIGNSNIVLEGGLPMAENYCGKNCEACNMKETLSCSGCKAGPGRMYGGECPVAKCCQERGHNTCATCNQNNWCSKQRNAEDMAETRFRKLEWERARRAQLEKQVPLLAKCFTVIFWLSIISLIPGIMSNDLTIGFPVLHTTGLIINAAFSLAILAVYFCMGRVNRHYRKAAAFMTLVTAGEYLGYWITSETFPGWSFILKIAILVVGLFCRYHMCTAHSEILVSVDYALSEKWMQLWKWYIYVLVGSFASIVVIFIFPLLGSLIVIAVGIATIVLSITELVYFCRMMVAFRTYARELAA